MAALSQTAASVVFSSAAQVGPVLTAGATIAKGQPCYLDSVTNTVKLAGAASTAAVAACIGLAYYGAAATQQIQIVSKDSALVTGFTGTAGLPVQLHTTAGSFTQTQADLSSGNYGVSFGSMTSTTVLNFTGVSVGSVLA